jgi:hypothetical protein
MRVRRDDEIRAFGNRLARDDLVIREHVHGNACLGGGDREPVVGGRRYDLCDRDALPVQGVEDRRAEIARSDERNLS